MGRLLASSRPMVVVIGRWSRRWLDGGGLHARCGASSPCPGGHRRRRAKQVGRARRRSARAVGARLPRGRAHSVDGSVMACSAVGGSRSSKSSSGGRKERVCDRAVRQPAEPPVGRGQPSPFARMHVRRLGPRPCLGPRLLRSVAPALQRRPRRHRIGLSEQATDSRRWRAIYPARGS